MDALKRYVIEIIAGVWLVLIAAQYLSSYFFRGLELDFAYIYVVMLVLTALTIGLRAYKRLSS